MLRSITAVCVSMAACANALGDPTLVGHWRFDEAAGPTAFDSSPNGHNGTLVNAAHFVAGGVSGNAIRLDEAGGAYVEMPAIPFSGGPLSLSAWVRTASIAYTIVCGRFVPSVTAGYCLGVNGGSGPLFTKAFSFVSAATAGVPISATPVNDNQWHLLTMTYTPGGEVTMYVDGRLESSRPASAYVSTSSPFLVGAAPTTAGQRIPRFTGWIDDVRLYDGALDAAAVCELHRNPGGMPRTCPADLNFDKAVNFADLNRVLSDFGQTGLCLPGDTNGDDQVNFMDLNLVLSAFGSTC